MGAGALVRNFLVVFRSNMLVFEPEEGPGEYEVYSGCDDEAFRAHANQPEPPWLARFHALPGGRGHVPDMVVGHVPDLRPAESNPSTDPPLPRIESLEEYQAALGVSDMGAELTAELAREYAEVRASNDELSRQLAPEGLPAGKRRIEQRLAMLRRDVIALQAESDTLAQAKQEDRQRVARVNYVSTHRSARKHTCTDPTTRSAPGFW